MHDEILLEIPEDEVNEAKTVLEGCMIKGMKTIVKDIPVVVDSSIGYNWCK